MQAELRFYAELKDFLAPSARPSGRLIHTFDVPGSVKDVIEAHGIPHTEVDLIVANGESVGFDHQVADGDRIAVYPVFEALDISPVAAVRPEPLRRTRFVLDGHLRRLARYLRLVGFDAVCDGSWSDHDLVAIASTEHRILLTRDIGLLKHGAVTHGSFVRSTDPREQLVDIVRRFHLTADLEPFTRCMECNGVLESVDPGIVADRVPPAARQAFEAFWQCEGCRRVYWQGSHFAELTAIVETARRADT